MAAKSKTRTKPAAESAEVMAEMLLEAGRQATRIYQNLETYKPQRAGGYVRISNDPFGLERGVKRQMTDITEKADHIGWRVEKFYIENDRSAYRKKKITLPDGRVVWRVVRPEFRQMLYDLFTGVIDGIIVYDQDRLLRQPRDLEDLIDIVEAVQRPVTGITTSINLLTSDGRAMARVMAAMALKSSEDTARRVERAKLQDALDGSARTARSFGRGEDGSIIEEEKKAARKAAEIALATRKWCQATFYLERKSGVKPVTAAHWHSNTVRNMLLNPSIAGLSVYRGAMRKDGKKLSSGAMNVADPKADALTDATGQYVTNGLPAILDVEVWERLCDMAKEAHEGRTPSVVQAKKYLLSGLLRCGNIRKDGTVCGRHVAGVRVKRPTKSDPDKFVVIYRCPGTSQGGCAGVGRNADAVNDFVERLFFKYLATKAPKRTTPAEPAEPAEVTKAEQHLATLQERLATLRKRYSEGDPNVTSDTYYATLPGLEASIKKAQAKLTELRKTAPPQLSAHDVAEEWRSADTAGKRMILARYLEAIEIKPSKTRGRAGFDATAINPIWKSKSAATKTESVTLAA